MLNRFFAIVICALCLHICFASVSEAFWGRDKEEEKQSESRDQLLNEEIEKIKSKQEEEIQESFLSGIVKKNKGTAQPKREIPRERKTMTFEQSKPASTLKNDKFCPTCKRTFDNSTLLFCPYDGSDLRQKL